MRSLCWLNKKHRRRRVNTDTASKSWWHSVQALCVICFAEWHFLNTQSKPQQCNGLWPVFSKSVSVEYEARWAELSGQALKTASQRKTPQQASASQNFLYVQAVHSLPCQSPTQLHWFGCLRHFSEVKSSLVSCGHLCVLKLAQKSMSSKVTDSVKFPLHSYPYLSPVQSKEQG